MAQRAGGSHRRAPHTSCALTSAARPVEALIAIYLLAGHWSRGHAGAFGAVMTSDVRARAPSASELLSKMGPPIPPRANLYSNSASAPIRYTQWKTH
jgi:hypothetical protein